MSFFIVPIEGTGTYAEPRREKYIPALGVARAMVDHDDNAIVWADTTPAQDAALALNADVIVVPPLDNTVALVATQNELEAINIPAGWITAAMTYRDVLRALVGAAQLIQATETFGAKVRLAGNLDVTVAALPANIRQALADASDSLGLDRSAVTGATTVRQVLRIAGKQWLDGRGVTLGPL